MAANPKGVTTLAEVLRARGEETYFNLRDLLAFVHVMGAWPTHLRSASNSLIREATVMTRGAGLDGNGGLKVLENVAHELDLDSHPQVTVTKAHMVRGFTILRGMIKSRRSFTRVPLIRSDGRRVEVRSDGSIQGAVLD